MTFLVTGVSKGLGLEIVKGLLHKGHTVIGVSRNPPEGLANPHFHFISQDLSQQNDSYAELVEKVVAHQGGIDGLVLNAAAALDDFEDPNIDWSRFNELLQVNALAPIRLFSDVREASSQTLQVAVISSLSVIFDPHLARVGYPVSKALLSSWFTNIVLKSRTRQNIRIYELGRLTNGSGGLFCLNYKQIAQKIVSDLLAKKPSSLIRRPLIPNLLGRVLASLPLLWCRKLVLTRTG